MTVEIMPLIQPIKSQSLVVHLVAQSWGRLHGGE